MKKDNHIILDGDIRKNYLILLFCELKVTRNYPLCY